jgi:small subunit ribosomal protein S4
LRNVKHLNSSLLKLVTQRIKKTSVQKLSLDKQKVRFTYGISEKQFGNYINEAVAHKGAPATEYLFELMERRLDNAVYRLGLAHTRRLSRQMVSHGHITVNGKKSTVASQRVNVGDIIAVREGSKKSILFADMARIHFP